MFRESVRAKVTKVYDLGLLARRGFVSLALQLLAQGGQGIEKAAPKLQYSSLILPTWEEKRFVL